MWREGTRGVGKTSRDHGWTCAASQCGVDAKVPWPYAAAPRFGDLPLSTTIIAEKPEHQDGIESVLNRAFGPGRFAKTSERVRERGAMAEPTLSRVGIDERGKVIGVCRISTIEAGAPLFFLGPLAVDPDAQAAGLGLNLVREAVAACRSRGGAAIVLVGAERFFRPVGFSLIPDGRLKMPGPVDPARFLWLELRRGGFDKLHGELKAPH